MDYDILPMNHSHIDSICELEKISFSSPWSREALEYQIDCSSSFFLTACERESGRVIGYTGVQEIAGEAYITNVAVFPAYRRRGVAGALISKAASDSFERGCAFITLEVRRSNTAAVTLYEKLGFELSGARKNFYSDPPEDGLIYTLFNRK